ncbi:MAG: SagB/ThcOx family dehydrogenase [Chitinivibrionales bacterium]|nr:SagB/ThcOx family dehydrogenase [Chitinivibrionales bacterium]
MLETATTGAARENRLIASSVARLLALAALVAACGAGEKRAAEGDDMDNRTMQLPSFAAGTTSVGTAIMRRRSVREFADTPLTREQLGSLLFAAQGITDTSRGYRAAPSAGATYPLEIYVVSHEGVYRYRPSEHAIQQVSDTDRRRELSEACLGQRWVAQAPANLVIVALPERTTARYKERGERYVHMEAGHAAQNVHLTAVALGLGSVPVGAFDDSEVVNVVECGDEALPLYVIPVGVPRQ